MGHKNRQSAGVGLGRLHRAASYSGVLPLRTERPVGGLWDWTQLVQVGRARGFSWCAAGRELQPCALFPITAALPAGRTQDQQLAREHRLHE
jgi:hypothetical protein